MTRLFLEKLYKIEFSFSWQNFSLIWILTKAIWSKYETGSNLKNQLTLIQISFFLGFSPKIFLLIFFKIPTIINRVGISKFSTLFTPQGPFFYALRGIHFGALKLLIFADPIWDLLLKLGFLGFKDNWISFFEP